MIDEVNKTRSVKVIELLDQINCVQRAISALRDQQNDFKAEYLEDISEVKWRLAELCHYKVWLTTKERVLKDIMRDDDKIICCKICRSNGFPHEPIIFSKVKRWIFHEYITGNVHAHKERRAV
jgi:hypothetical protein